MSQIAPGDEVLIDNSIYLATQTYHRHQIPPGDDFPIWDQFKAAGQPIYPQRPLLMGPRYALSGTGTMQTGRFAGKMILVEALLDEAAYPWQADWYRARVQDTLGEGLDDQFRLWFVDKAMHTGPLPVAERTEAGAHHPHRALMSACCSRRARRRRLGGKGPAAAGQHRLRTSPTARCRAADRRGAQGHPAGGRRHRQRRGARRGRGR